DTIADSDAQGPAGPPFPDDHADDGRGDTGHLQKVGGDKLSLAALLGADAGIGARGVDQADDRQAELGSDPHLDECLAVCIRMGTTVEALRPLLGGVSLLMADEHDPEVAEPREAG